MAKEKKEMSVLELSLLTEPWQEDRLNRKMNNVARIYNNMLRYKKNAYNEIISTRAFKEQTARITNIRNLTDDISSVRKYFDNLSDKYEDEEIEKGHKDLEYLKKRNCSDNEFLNCLRKITIPSSEKLEEIKRIREGLKKEDIKALKTELSGIYKERNEIYKSCGFTDFSFRSDSIKFASYYKASVPSVVANLSVGVPMWSAFEKLIYGNGKKVSFKKFVFSNSLCSDNKSAIRFVKKDDGYYVALSNVKAKAKPMEIKVRECKNKYERNMIDRKVKQTRILRRMEGTKYHYYVQLVVEGAPYEKMIDGQKKHPVNNGDVGLAIWRDELYAVSDNEVKRFSLEKGDIHFESERDSLNKKMEELRRKNNPDNFNEDGTIKKGRVVDGEKKPLIWHTSCLYKELRKEKRELERINRINRGLLHNEIVNELLKMGNNFYVAEYSFLTKKPKFDPDDRLSNNEYKKLKERRKSIQLSAPSELLAKLTQKLSQGEKGVISTFDIPEELYWYRFDTDSNDKSCMNGEYATMLGKTCPHTAYRAFIIKYFDDNKKVFNRDEIIDKWDSFVYNCMD